MDRRTGSQGHHRLPGRQRVATYFLGLAGGLGVNALSADVGYRGVAVAAAVAAILISSNWMRQFPSTAPLTRMASWGLLGGAALAAVLAVVYPGWEGPATLAATGLTVVAVLIPTELHQATGLLRGAALIGVGVAVIGLGVAVLRAGDVLRGTALIGGGIALIGLGIAVLRAGDVLIGVAVIGVGVAAIGGGVVVLRAGDLPIEDAGIGAGVVLIGFGIALIGLGIAVLRAGDVLIGVAAIGLGVAAIGVGVTILRRTGVFAAVVTWLTSLTKAPRGEAVPRDDSPVDESEDPPGNCAPASGSPPVR